MSIVLAGSLIASLGIIGAQLALIFWQVKRATTAQNDHLASSRRRGQLQRLADEQQRGIQDRDEAIDSLTKQNKKLRKALESVQQQRDKLLDEAFKNGDPSSIAASIRNALGGLQKMSDMSDDSAG